MVCLISKVTKSCLSHHCSTHSEKSLRNRRITKAVTQSRPKTGAGAQPNVVTSIEKQKQNNLRRQERLIPYIIALFPH